MLRVLHVLGALNRGGAETMIMNLYRSIDRSKIQFDFIIHTNRHCEYTDEILSMGGRIYSIDAFNGMNYFQYKKEWESFFDEHPEYSIIHGHMRSTASIYLPLARRKGVYTIAHSHNVSSERTIQGFGKNLLQMPLKRCDIADYYMACSVSAGEWLFGKKHIQGDNFSVLANAIDAKKYRFNSETRKLKRLEFNAEEKFIIGHVGRLQKQKNHMFLIQVFSEICKAVCNAELWLIGVGELKETIQGKARELNISDKVKFLGARQDVPELMQAMDVFLFPSLYEGLGIVAIESQAAGLKCICSDAVPQDVQISPFISFISLAERKKWVNEAVKASLGYQREDTYMRIVDSGFDISTTSKWIEEFYLTRGSI